MVSYDLPTNIRPDHLARRAFVSVRQSTLCQVREHTASTARQYDLVQRARDLGWAPEQSTVIDQDQGRSGASSTGRTGFQALSADGGLGQAGAVLSLEVSRLARSSRDWYRLLEICALTETLVIDEEGISDPGHSNDRLLLGCKGTMSAAELHWLRSRLEGGKRKKAAQGPLRFRPPVGLVFAPTGERVLDPDEEVQHAVQRIFALLQQETSALAVVTHFTTAPLRFPNRLWGTQSHGEVSWEPLRHARVLAMLHTPASAGTSVYGRTTTRTRLLPGDTPRIKGRTRRVAPEDWPILLHDVHPGYLTWAQFLQHQERLAENRPFRPAEHRGAVREGAALLQGLVLCGQCGRRMGVRSLADGVTPLSACPRAPVDFAAPPCQSLRGDGVAAAVARTFLDAIQPAHLEVALATLDGLAAQARQSERQWHLRLERAQYEADLARRRFLAVEPENRLVARSLEREWNEKLAEVARLERDSTAMPQRAPQLLSPEQQQRILALVHDLPTVWHAPTTTHVERQQLVRFLIKDVPLTRRATTIQMAIRWQPHACTTLEIPRPLRSCDTRRTSPAVLARIGELATSHTDRQLALLLHHEGYTAGLGGAFTAAKVQWLRWSDALPRPRPTPPEQPREDGRYSARAAAALLQVDVSTIADWCTTGQLAYLQEAPHHPRWITLPPERIAALRQPIQQRQPRHSPT